MNELHDREPEEAPEPEPREPGAHAASVPPAPRLIRIGKVVGAVAILAVIVGLMLFGDSLFGGGGDDAAEPTRPPSEPRLSAEDEKKLRPAVTGAATEVLDTWARPGAAYRGWWKQLRPLLTPGAREAYAHTDPQQLPDLGEVEPADTQVRGLGRQATVWFDTDGGEFGVDLSRKGGQWLANRVIFPGGESMFG